MLSNFSFSNNIAIINTKHNVAFILDIALSLLYLLCTKKQLRYNKQFNQHHKNDDVDDDQVIFLFYEFIISSLLDSTSSS